MLGWYGVVKCKTPHRFEINYSIYFSHMKDSTKLSHISIPVKVLFLVPYPLGEAPSQRFRFEQYLDLLQSRGIQYVIQPFLSNSNWRVFYHEGNYYRKAAALLTGFLRRIRAIAIARRFDFIFIHREAAPVGPPLVEWFLVVILRKKVIYDFDDAIWMTDRQDESFLSRLVKWRSKVGRICAWSYKVSCGNFFLCSYALKFNRAVVFNPTTLDTSSIHLPSRKVSSDNSVVIGWTGSHSTLKYLRSVETVLKKLTAEYPEVTVRIIADRQIDLDITRLEFTLWRKETEIEDLNQIDIGIMPLPDDEWSKGKCGFKALQYMALEIPAVASAVGANLSIIEHGVNGYLVTTRDEWLKYLKVLIENPELRRKLGAGGRQTVNQGFSVSANSTRFLGLFS